jgi:hypothetical protein
MEESRGRNAEGGILILAGFARVQPDEGVLQRVLDADTLLWLPRQQLREQVVESLDCDVAIVRTQNQVL